MEDMAKMIGSIVGGDKEGFESAFKAEMDTRVGKVVVDKNIEFSKDIISSDEALSPDAPVSEAYIFKSSSDANKFIKAASNAGLTKRNFKIKGKSVDISGIKDKDMNQMLQMLAKDMKATTK